MVLVLLVQHGKAYPEEVDPERRLTPEGVEETRRVAAALAAAGVAVDEVVHSGRTRARQTAEIMAEYLRPRLGVREADGLGPNDDPSIWASRLGSIDHSIMLVGHLPHLARLASLLLTGDAGKQVVKFRYSGVVALVRDEQGWGVAWYVTPDLITKQ